jgi:Toastrack DUF4097
VFRFPSAMAATAVLIVAAAGISGCGPQFSATQDYTAPVPVDSLIVNDSDGSVSVTGGSGSEVSVTATLTYNTTKPSVTHTIQGQTLTLGYSGCGDCAVSFTVTVPRTDNVTVNDQNGDVTVASLAGDVAVGEDTGDVMMTDLTGDLSIQNEDGNVSGTSLSAGQASFQNGNGDIDVAFAAAPRQLKAAADTGQVTIGLPSGTAYRVNASSGVGTADVTVPQSPAAAHVVTATSTTGTVAVN